jgi:hypothetical protein
LKETGNAFTKLDQGSRLTDHGSRIQREPSSEKRPCRFEGREGSLGVIVHWSYSCCGNSLSQAMDGFTLVLYNFFIIYTTAAHNERERERENLKIKIKIVQRRSKIERWEFPK